MIMITMKKIFFATAALFTLAMSQSFAATIKPYTAYPSAQGIVIITSDAVKNANKIELKRRETGKSWQTIASYFPATDMNAFANAYMKSSALVPVPAGFGKLAATQIWDAYQKLSVGDSLKWLGGILPARIALGYAYFDSTAKPNVNYEYEIISSSGSDKTTEAVSFPGRSDYGTLKRDTSFSDGKFIEAVWSAKTNHRAFNVLVYRSHNYSKDFVRITPDFWIEKNKKDTTLFYHIKDTAVFQSQIYRYVIIPVDVFGAASAPSDTMICNSLQLNTMSVIQKLHVGNIERGGGILVSWKTDFSANLMGYNVFRSEQSDNDFKMVSFIPASDTSYSDYNVEMMKPYYYYVEPVTVTSIKLPRSATAFGMYQEKIKPEAPRILGALSINHGVELHIQFIEKNISGYRVYRNSKSDSTFQLISGLIPVKIADAFSTFIDTSNLSGGFIYSYKVRAENASQLMSDFSKPVSATPMNASKPQPVSCTTKLELGRVVLLWKSDTLNKSILSFELWRREKGEEKFSPLLKNSVNGKARMYIDSTVEVGKTYEYAVTCNDRFGGKSDFVYTSVIEIPLPLTVSPSTVTAVPASDGILISWSAVFETGLKNYNVYRYEKGAKPQLLGTIEGSEKNLSYKDSSASKGKMYFYFVTTTNSSGAQSKPTTEAGVKW